jgi:hypothetical protein
MKLNKELYFNEFWLLLTCTALGYASSFFGANVYVPLWVFIICTSALLILMLLLWKYKVLGLNVTPPDVSRLLAQKNGKLIFEKHSHFKMHDCVSIYIEDGSSILIGMGFIESVLSESENLQVEPLVDFDTPALMGEHYNLEANRHVTFIKRSITFDVLTKYTQKVKEADDE